MVCKLLYLFSSAVVPFIHRMIFAELILHSNNLEWHIPWHRPHTPYPTTAVGNDIPTSLLFNRRQWTERQCKEIQMWTKPFPLNKGLVVDQQTNNTSSKRQSTQSQHTLHSNRKKYIKKINNDLRKTDCKSSTHVHTQPALFYPTTDHDCTQEERLLTTIVDVDVNVFDKDQQSHTMSDTTCGVDTETMDENSSGYEDAEQNANTNENDGNNCDDANEHQFNEFNHLPCISKPAHISVPMVSVIMATYNCAKYIEFAIRSIQLQTLTNWELIVVNDRSTDNTDSLLRTMAYQDDRIIYLHNQHNLGCYASKNIGIQYARGQWLTFQDADDYSMSERLEKQLTLCISGQAAPRETHSDNTKYDCCYVTSLSRKEKVWSWVPITMFIRAHTFRNILGSFDVVRFGADSEIRERMDVLGIHVGVFDDYLYACPDRWIELASRQQSLTGNNQHNPIRRKYKKAFTTFHNKMRQLPLEIRKQCLKYTFGSSVNRPFEIGNLNKEETDIFYPDKKNILLSMQMNAQLQIK